MAKHIKSKYGERFPINLNNILKVLEFFKRMNKNREIKEGGGSFWRKFAFIIIAGIILIIIFVVIKIYWLAGLTGFLGMAFADGALKDKGNIRVIAQESAQMADDDQRARNMADQAIAVAEDAELAHMVRTQITSLDQQASNMALQAITDAELVRMFRDAAAQVNQELIIEDLDDVEDLEDLEDTTSQRDQELERVIELIQKKLVLIQKKLVEKLIATVPSKNFHPITVQERINRESNAEVDMGCPICFEEMNLSDSCITRCGHRFHDKCILNIFARGKLLCPFCRTPLGGPPICRKSEDMTAEPSGAQPEDSLKPEPEPEPEPLLRAGTPPLPPRRSSRPPLAWGAASEVPDEVQEVQDWSDQRDLVRHYP